MEPAPRPIRDDESFTDWLLAPQTLIALSAVLLSICGLFVSLYETSLMRQEQRASVWPRVSIGFTINDTLVTFIAENAGVGPARVQSAEIRHNDSTMVNWSELMRRTSSGPLSVSSSLNLVNGRVMSPEKRVEFAKLDFRDEQQAAALAESVLDGTTDIRACYCSVYNECWVTSLQQRLSGMRRIGIGYAPDTTSLAPSSSRVQIQQPERVASCDTENRSAI
jgi:hypothetical protein